MKKRIWCIALVLGIATIFSGCGVSSNKKDAETNKTETSTSAKTSKKKSVKNEKDLIYPTRLGSLGWIDSSTVGERICFGPIIGAFSNYQRGSVTNKEENKSKASENGWIDPFNALLIRESFTEERAKDYELKYAEKLEEVPDILRIQKFWGDALSDYAGLGSGDDDKIDIVVGPEARGFIFGCPVSYALGVGFVPVRKPGKLPREVIEYAYDLEYGSNKLCLHKDSIKPGQKVLVVDDLLATGGTVEATIKLVEELGGVVAGLAFLIELVDLKGREKLSKYPMITLMQY